MEHPNEKLTAAITIKLTEADAHAARALARSKDMELSEYIRHLILKDKHLAQQRWSALSQIFGECAGADQVTLV
jgi:hypothetical protein